MSARKAIVILAVWSALVPFLGFPSSWKTFFVTASGIGIVLLSVDWRAFRRKKRPTKGRTRRRDEATEVFVESAPPARADARREEY